MSSFSKWILKHIFKIDIDKDVKKAEDITEYLVLGTGAVLTTFIVMKYKNKF